MNTELSSFLADVWENRDYILFNAPRNPDETIEDRVYDIYAPQHGITASITPEVYETQVSGITAPPLSKPWRFRSTGGFRVADNLGAESSSVNCRIYLNVKLENAVHVFKIVLDKAKMPLYEPSRSGPPSLTTPSLSIPQDILSRGHLARTKAMGESFEGSVIGAKIAEKEQAFSGRPDIIVIYMPTELQAIKLAEYLAKLGPYYKNDIPAMTKRIAWGISIGAEVWGEQWKVGTSFGGLRCNLVARALIKSVIGTDMDGKRILRKGTTPPLPSPNRLDFFNEVTKQFTMNKISITEPWN